MAIVTEELRRKTPLISLIEAEGALADMALRKWGGALDLSSLRPRPGVVGRALLKGMLAYATGISADTWRFETAASGQPLVFANAGLTPSISMSHSGVWVACALSLKSPVGIDIEMVNSKRDTDGIALLAFGTGERARANSDGPLGFYRLWTLREAMAKANGQGISMAADGRDRVVDGPDQGIWHRNIEGADWLLMHERPHADLSLAVAARGIPDELSPFEWWIPRETCIRVVDH